MKPGLSAPKFRGNLSLDIHEKTAWMLRSLLEE